MQLAEALLKSHEHGFKTHTNFSFSLGVIPVLFVIAWRSNNTFLRDKSLELLRLTDRREGIWDSKVAFHIAHRYIALKAASIGFDAGCHIQISELNFNSENTCQMIYRVVGSGMPPAGDLLSFEGCVGERRYVEIIRLGSD